MNTLIGDHSELLPAAYLLKPNKPNQLGDLSLTLQLLINPRANNLIGVSQVYATTDTNTNVQSSVDGDWQYIPSVNKPTIVIVLNGVCATKVRFNGEVKEVENLKVRLLLNEDWQFGYGMFEYKKEGTWHKVASAVAQLDERTGSEKLDRLYTLCESVKTHAY
ncbi:DUF1842 domain-containing protein [Pseudoalteromonas sp. S16_S37]|uniref:DUF1842 domain-containing protein n=1 Tax=Pseudoalteromonas sp. S16_S37 TaxID=2720228 RepID=UPI001680B7DF|nr:DUF1842 domain-containing protein [Pseudoalteromonas sp. S16_S37]MBD1583753.1 DUF1842 domain-containing protein [Pseudoalteromonas sp. S16_S37]